MLLLTTTATDAFACGERGASIEGLLLARVDVCLVTILRCMFSFNSDGYKTEMCSTCHGDDFSQPGLVN